MLEDAKDRARARLAAARLRETKYLLSFDLRKLNRKLLILLSVFVVLNFFDALTTLVALGAKPNFVELNPIASGLFSLNFPGFLVALTLKYMPILPLAYVTFLSPEDKREFPLRIVKVSGLVALAAADLFYLAVVGSNLSHLLLYYMSVW